MIIISKTIIYQIKNIAINMMNNKLERPHGMKKRWKCYSKLEDNNYKGKESRL
jgi:hypothetical protein